MSDSARAVAVLAAVGGLAIGAYAAHELYLVSTNDAPLEISVAEFLRQKPDATWLTLTDCELDPNDSFVKQDGRGQVEEVFVPVHPAGTLATEPPYKIHILAARPPTSTERMTMSILGLGHLSRDQTVVRGLLRFGIHEGGRDRRELRNLVSRIGEDVVVLDEGRRPDKTFAMTLLLLALGTLGIAAMAFNKSRQVPQGSLHRRRGPIKAGVRRMEEDDDAPRRPRSRSRDRDRGGGRRGGSNRRRRR